MSRMGLYILRCIVFGWLLVEMAALTCSTKAGPFKADGKLVYFDGNSIPRKDYTFSFYGDKSKWSLKLYLEGKTNQLGHSEYAVEDGDLYFIEFSNDQPMGNLVRSNKSPAIVNGLVREDLIPCDFVSFPHVYWMAFRCPVSAENRPSRLPAGFVYNTTGIKGPEWVKTIEDWKLNAQYHFEPRTNGDLTEIDILNPGVQYGFQGKTYPLSPPYDKGHTLATLKILSRTNIGSDSVATKFVWETFRPRADGVTSNDLEKLYFCEGTVSRIVEVPELSSVEPQIPHGVSVVVKDYRYLKMSQSADPNSAYYVSANGFLTPTNSEFMRQAKYQAKVDRIQWNQGLAKILIFGVVLISVVFVFFGFRNNDSAKKIEN
jgi:hypothetical protein